MRKPDRACLFSITEGNTHDPGGQDGVAVGREGDAGLAVIESADTRRAETQGQEAIEGCGGPAAQQMPEYDRAGFFAGQGFKFG